MRHGTPQRTARLSASTAITSGGVFGGLTALQLTADINPFMASLPGLAPASGGGTTNFLRADGISAPEAPVGVTLSFEGSSSISVQACAAFGGQDAELTTLSGLRAQALRGRHGTGQQ
jgi:hypothetical protein